MEENKGLDVSIEQTLKCADCEKDLINIIKVRDSEKELKIKCLCDECEGESWILSLTGDYVYGIIQSIHGKKWKMQNKYLHMDYDPETNITTAQVKEH